MTHRGASEHNVFARLPAVLAHNSNNSVQQICGLIYRMTKGSSLLTTSFQTELVDNGVNEALHFYCRTTPCGIENMHGAGGALVI